MGVGGVPENQEGLTFFLMCLGRSGLCFEITPLDGMADAAPALRLAIFLRVKVCQGAALKAVGRGRVTADHVRVGNGDNVDIMLKMLIS